MRILAVSDEVSRYYYDFYSPGKLDEFDLILSCGDLDREYLEFLVTMARCPLVYVRGNHDEGFAARPPEGCDCAEDRIVTCGGVRILGLGGSYRYRPGENLYTEAQMRRRVRRLTLALWRSRGFDILLTHAPARGVNDMENLSHRGFACFLPLLDRYRPAYFIHGHVHHSYGVHIPRCTRRGETEIINACGCCVLDFP